MLNPNNRDAVCAPIGSRNFNLTMGRPGLRESAELSPLKGRRKHGRQNQRAISGPMVDFRQPQRQSSCKLCGDLDTAQETQRIIAQQLAPSLLQFPKRDEKKHVPTLAEYYEKFSATYLKGGVRESTAERYKQCFTHHLLPALGAKRVNEITWEDPKVLITGLVEKKLAKCTIRNITACLCSVVSHAVEDRIIMQNPAAKLGRYFQEARVVHEEIDRLTADEVPIFLAKARARDLRRWKGNLEYCPLFLCAIHTGMRAGELA
jgi:hypothetical protein